MSNTLCNKIKNYLNFPMDYIELYILPFVKFLSYYCLQKWQKLKKKQAQYKHKI